ncbi:unnamed protein product, partial [Mesorhabditis belari]|uniref:Hormone-sensitive lipase n=1 Tax=Mesorhabditis belari TaxID=2138241 RepID=A0AAF3ERN6_9BILA
MRLLQRSTDVEILKMREAYGFETASTGGLQGCGVFDTKESFNSSTRRNNVGMGGERQKQHKLSPRLSIDRSAIYNLLYKLANDNEEYFTKFPTTAKYGQRIVEACIDVQQTTPKLKELVMKLQEIAPRFDYDEKVPGNGFRSLVCICDTVVLHLISLLRVCSEMRGSLMFRLSHYTKEIEAYNTVVYFLLEALPQTLSTQEAMPDGFLFPNLKGDYGKWHELLRGVEKLDSSCFYGRPLGFQFSPTCSRIFRFIGIILATYSLSWEKGHGPIGSLINSGRFFLSPEQRAARIIKVTKEADIGFCKGFWNLSELGNNVPKLFLPNMAVNDLREIVTNGPLSMETNDGDRVPIPEPSAHTGYRPVKIRVMSHLHRQGLSPSNISNQQPASPYLLFHCHGGGYVATSSKSHETYLRVWAKLLNCTIVSVEYSLAPENPFPRPTEEVLFAYAWIVNNPQLFGWTGERVCMVGDSAGGNLIVSLNLRLIQLNVKRKPDGLVPCYTPFLFQYLPSPSRLLSVMDPLLHMGVVLRCVAAYTGAYTFKSDEDNGGSTVPREENGHKSLQEYVEQVQKTQRIDFTSGSQSIVSLVNLSQNNSPNGTTPTESTSFFKINGTIPSVSCPQREDEEMESEEDDDNQSMSSVRIDSDPLHIHISPSVFDNNFVNFLQTHPITKDQVLWCDEKGVTIPSPDDIDEVAQEVKAEIMNETDDLTTIASSTSSHTLSSVPIEKPTKTTLSASLSNNSLGSYRNPPLCHKRSLSQTLADTASLAAGHALDNLSEWFDRPQKKLERTTGSQELAQEKEETENRSHLLELLNRSAVPRDPLISPMYADDHLIRELPPMHLIGCHLDPLLDDTIAFARKLKDAGGKVASLDLLPHVPHGFLNFTLMSPECRDGAKVCLTRIRQALGIPHSHNG